MERKKNYSIQTKKLSGFFGKQHKIEAKRRERCSAPPKVIGFLEWWPCGDEKQSANPLTDAVIT